MTDMKENSKKNAWGELRRKAPATEGADGPLYTQRREPVAARLSTGATGSEATASINGTAAEATRKAPRGLSGAGGAVEVTPPAASVPRRLRRRKRNRPRRPHPENPPRLTVAGPCDLRRGDSTTTVAPLQTKSAAEAIAKATRGLVFPAGLKRNGPRRTHPERSGGGEGRVTSGRGET
jgi:hypothetical protein